VVWTIAGGVPTSKLLGQTGSHDGFQFVQISDSHIGFNKPANTDVNATFAGRNPGDQYITYYTGLPDPHRRFDPFGQARRVRHTGPTSAGREAKQVFYVPGEHDNATDDGKEYLTRHGKRTKGSGWYSFDHHGVHFVGLVNSVALEGMGKLGAGQLAWLKDDLSARSASTPIVLFAHLPLRAV